MEINFTKLSVGDRLVREKGGIFSKHHVLFAGINPRNNEYMVAECQVGYGVRLITLRQFLQEGKLVRVEYNGYPRASQNIIIKRIQDRIGKPYSLLNYNCEQFVNDVLHGVAESKQVENGVKAVLGSSLLLLFLSIIAD